MKKIYMIPVVSCVDVKMANLVSLSVEIDSSEDSGGWDEDNSEKVKAFRKDLWDDQW